jgi:hypothetical protein
LHYPGSCRDEERGVKRKRVDNAYYWMRKELLSSLAVVAEMASSCELRTATPGSHGDHQS